LKASHPLKNPVVYSSSGTAIFSGYSGVTAGPGIGKKFVQVSAGGTGGELIEQVAEIRPRIAPMPRRTGTKAEQH